MQAPAALDGRGVGNQVVLSVLKIRNREKGKEKERKSVCFVSAGRRKV
jgi:hypothetical protein